MKNLYTTILFTICFSLLGTMCLTAQIVYIPDPNFKAALLSDSNINTNGDGEIQVSEAEAAVDVSVVGNNINDLTGIEAFINITFLECSDNNLTSIDISNNLELEIFECYNNQLTNIDISQNTALYQFECRFNQLTSLDLSNNPNIVLLSMGNNDISELDLANNNALLILECTETLLESLDLSHNTNLISLICNDNDALSYINLKNGNNENLVFDGPFPSNFENLPSLETICIDDINNTALIDEITGQVGHQVDFTEECILGTENVDFNEVRIYPVPIGDELYISAITPIVQIDVYNLLGQKVHSMTQEDSILEVSTEKLPIGVYIVMLQDSNGRVTTTKVIRK
ncbi:MAG: T9SS type A sorting domain-containing protein [Aequorivita sp.]